jgi:MFS family permease
MDIGAILNDSFQYAKEGVWGKWKKWFFLIVSMIIFPFILGYMVRMYRGEKPAPELEQWGSMFVDGLKFLCVQLIYATPVILLIIAAFLPFFPTLFVSGLFTENTTTMSEAQAEQFFGSHPEILPALGTMIILLALAVILAIVIGIFSFIGSVRFARTGSIAEGFNFSAILATIRKIGWINYLLALIVIGVIGMVFGFLMNLVMMIPFIGFIIWFFLYPPFILFGGRYASLVYDKGEREVIMQSNLPGQTP